MVMHRPGQLGSRRHRSSHVLHLLVTLSPPARTTALSWTSATLAFVAALILVAGALVGGYALTSPGRTHVELAKNLAGQRARAAVPSIGNGVFYPPTTTPATGSTPRVRAVVPSIGNGVFYPPTTTPATGSTPRVRAVVPSTGNGVFYPPTTTPATGSTPRVRAAVPSTGNGVFYPPTTTPATGSTPRVRAAVPSTGNGVFYPPTAPKQWSHGEAHLSVEARGRSLSANVTRRPTSETFGLSPTRVWSRRCRSSIRQAEAEAVFAGLMKLNATGRS